MFTKHLQNLICKEWIQEGEWVKTLETGRAQSGGSSILGGAGHWEEQPHVRATRSPRSQPPLTGQPVPCGSGKLRA
ncbi:mCG1042014 [Mus musculus]|nr:mCG1042014 [Mus musculus]